MVNFDQKIIYEHVEARAILQPLSKALRESGIFSANNDARCLLGLVLGRDDPVLPHEKIALWNQSNQIYLDELKHRRKTGEPISRMRGWREFWSMRFTLSPATLDPRPDSECLIGAVIDWSSRQHCISRCLDIGTGSGCLLLACLSELTFLTGVGIDISAEALCVAVNNAKMHGLADRTEFCLHDFASDLTEFGQFDLIITNPPYIPTTEIAKLDSDVRNFDPMTALDGGLDGLDCWRILCPQISTALSDGGSAFVEIGAGQKSAVCKLALASGLRFVTSFKDLAGRYRCLQFRKEI